MDAPTHVRREESSVRDRVAEVVGRRALATASCRGDHGDMGRAVRHICHRRVRSITIGSALLLIALTLGACSGGGSSRIIVETASATPTPAPSATPTPTSTPDVTPPTAGRWIEVDVSRYIVRLREGSNVIRQIAPVAVGAQVDTGAYESTQTGLFHVYNKIAGLTYDAPYDTYIDWWVGFDPDKANGFHSFLEDRQGAVVDDSTGHVSNGCIRTGEPQAVFDFAQVGMPVLVHS